MPDVVAVRLPAAVLSDLKEANSPQLVLSVRFALDIQPGLDGLYLSRWIGDNERLTIWLRHSLKLRAARKAFPCVDQPDAKAHILSLRRLQVLLWIHGARQYACS